MREDRQARRFGRVAPVEVVDVLEARGYAELAQRPVDAQRFEDVRVAAARGRIVGGEALLQRHRLEAENDGDGRLQWPRPGEERRVIFEHARDLARSLDPVGALSVEVEQRPLTGLRALSPRVEQPEDDAVGARADAGPYPLRDVFARGAHRPHGAVQVGAAL